MFLVLLILIVSKWTLYTGTTFCGESYSCTDYNNNGTFIHDNSIWCRGYQSCSNAESLLAHPVSLRCHGSHSCFNTTFTLSTAVQECFGLDSCSNIKSMNTHHDVECHAENACQKSILNATKASSP